MVQTGPQTHEQNPRDQTTLPGCNNLWCDNNLDAIGASSQSGCARALGCGQTNPRDVFDLQEHLQSPGFVLKGSRAGVWSPAGLAPPLTGQSFRDC